MHLSDGRNAKMEEKKNNKHRLTKVEREERKFNKDLKDCMRCKFFWGNDSRCINSNCFKEKRKEPEKTVRSECTDCSYKQGDGYCFPCMKKILERK